MSDQWGYLKQPAYRVRQGIAESWLSPCRTVVEVGGGVTPIASPHQAHLNVDPLAGRGGLSLPLAEAGTQIEGWLADNPDQPLGLCLLGLDLELTEVELAILDSLAVRCERIVIESAVQWQHGITAAAELVERWWRGDLLLDIIDVTIAVCPTDCPPEAKCYRERWFALLRRT